MTVETTHLALVPDPVAPAEGLPAADPADLGLPPSPTVAAAAAEAAPRPTDDPAAALGAAMDSLLGWVARRRPSGDDPLEGPPVPWSEGLALVQATRERLKAVRITDRRDRDLLWGQVRKAEEEIRSLQRARGEALASESARHRLTLAAWLDDGERALAAAASGPAADRSARLREASQAATQARRVLHEARHRMGARDKKESFDEIGALQARVDGAWAAHKEEGARWREQREHREAQRLRREEHTRIQLLERLDDADGFLHHLVASWRRLEAHLAELRDKLATAWGDGFREKVTAWIAEAEQRLPPLSERIQRVERQVDDLQRAVRMGGAPPTSRRPSAQGGRPDRVGGEPPNSPPTATDPGVDAAPMGEGVATDTTPDGHRGRRRRRHRHRGAGGPAAEHVVGEVAPAHVADPEPDNASQTV